MNATSYNCSALSGNFRPRLLGSGLKARAQRLGSHSIRHRIEDRFSLKHRHSKRYKEGLINPYERANSRLRQFNKLGLKFLLLELSSGSNILGLKHFNFDFFGSTFLQTAFAFQIFLASHFFALTGFHSWGLVTRWAQLLITSNY